MDNSCQECRVSGLIERFLGGMFLGIPNLFYTVVFLDQFLNILRQSGEA